MPRLLALAEEAGLECEIDVDGRRLLPLPGRGRRRPPPPAWRGWRKRLFVAMSRNAASPVDYFHLPGERTVTIGSQIEL